MVEQRELPKRTPLTATIARPSQAAAVGSADLPWSELGFEFRETKSHLKFTWREGEGWVLNDEAWTVDDFVTLCKMLTRDEHLWRKGLSPDEVKALREHYKD